MPEPNTSSPSITKKREGRKETCEHIVGDDNCKKCVNKGICPSDKMTLEEVAAVESGKDYCVGKS